MMGGAYVFAMTRLNCADLLEIKLATRMSQQSLAKHQVLVYAGGSLSLRNDQATLSVLMSSVPGYR